MPAALEKFVNGMNAVVERRLNSLDTMRLSEDLMLELVAKDDWLPAAYARPNPVHYQQFALHVDPQARYSIVSFVWGPGQRTPVHDHGVWGVIGMLRGEETSQAWRLTEEGPLQRVGSPIHLRPGMTERVSPETGDIHEVWNPLPDRAAVSIHVYGADIGRHPRRVFDPVTGQAKVFISGYADANEVRRV